MPNSTQLFALKYSLLSGISQILVGCLLGGPIADMPNPQMGKAGHHQMTTNGVFLMAIAFCFPYCKLSKFWLRIAFVTAQFGTWCNGLAYWILAFTNAPNPMFLKSSNLAPEGENNIYTYMSIASLLFCGVNLLLNLTLLIWGILDYDITSNSKNE